MKMSRVKVSNFRCIDTLEFFPHDYTSLIGPNNAGKSSTLRAIEILLNQITPGDDEWRRGFESAPIVIEADFDELLEWERQRPGVSSLVYNDRIQLRLTIKPTSEAEGRKKPELVYECKKPSETIRGWADKWGDLDPEISSLAATEQIDGKAWKSVANKERVRQLVREQLPARVTTGAPEWTSDGISIDAALKQALPQAQIIPAVRDAANDGAPGAATSFGMFLKKIIMPAVSGSEEYRQLKAAVTNLDAKLRGDGSAKLEDVANLERAIADKLSPLISATVAVGMDPPDADKFIGANTVLRLDDGTQTRIGLQGHGLQRSLVFAMLEILATQSATLTTNGEGADRTRHTVLLFEEPELFMHPHLMRQLKQVLAKIAARPDWQVIVTTHSPFLVDIADERRSLVIHRRERPNQSPTVTQLRADPLAGETKKAERTRLRAILDFHPAVCEAFFAKNVVLVEGDTELAVLTKQDALFRLAGVSNDIVRNTTVVSCDGKWTIVPIARLLRAFGIPVRVVHDIDLKGQTPDQLRDEPSTEWKANAAILEVVGDDHCYPVDDTFEDVLSVPGDAFSSTADKPYRAWCRVRELCDEKTDLTHVPKLKEVVEFAFRPQPADR